MIEISFFAGELLLFCVFFTVRGIFAIVRRRIDWKREAMLLLLYVNLAVILRFTFYPMQRLDGKVQPLVFDACAAWPYQINAVPMIHLLEYDTKRELLLNLIGNCAMFIPSGIIFPLLDRKVTNFPKTVLSGAALSLAIELLQLPAARTSDIDDLILNTAGAAVGGAIFFAVRAIIRRSKGKKNAEASNRSA